MARAKSFSIATTANSVKLFTGNRISVVRHGNGVPARANRNAARKLSDTSLIIIDTLSKECEAGGDNYSYANDYQIITRLKALADSYGICLLLVHHTRKQQADDKFDMISGNNGWLGAADGAFLLIKENAPAYPVRLIPQ